MSKEEALTALKVLDPEVRKWFLSRFYEPTLPQKKAFPLIARGKNVLITAPTGTGKTLAGFLVIISELIKLYKAEKLEDSIYCVYVSPLRALNNDIRRNLLKPLQEMGYEGKIRVEVRTGDTPPSQRAKHLKKPPHILITTPESLAIALNAPKLREKLKEVKWVIVDEIHELADSKRGVHLTLSLERLVELAGEFQRIGLSATIHPLEEVAKFLGGKDGKGNLRPVKIVNAMWSKPLDVMVISPVDDLVFTPAETVNQELYRLLKELIENHRTTIIFTNTRSATERVTYNLKELFKGREFLIEAHHGSMSRERRLEVEERLKKGELKAVVCSTSLELGIDVGYVDLVVQLGSPKSVTRAMQRIGRSGHTPFSVAKGRIVVIDRDDALECTVMLKAALEKHLDRIRIPKAPLDVLIQHLLGMALERKWRVEEAYEVVKRAYPYWDLSYEDFLTALYYLAGKYVDLSHRKVYAKIWLEDGFFGRRGKLTRVIYFLNIGTIPDEVKIDVYELPKRRWVGSIEEDFLERLRKGDVFVLGGRRYRFLYSRGMKAYVEPAEHEIPNVPSWFSEMLPLSFELAEMIRSFRKKVEEIIKTRGREAAEEWIFNNYPVERKLAKAVVEYVEVQSKYLKVPEPDEILVEITKDELLRPLAVFHALFGRKVNDVLSRAIAALIGKRIRRDIRIAVGDHGFVLILPQRVPKEVIQDALEELKAVDLEFLLKRYLTGTELIRRRFRHAASRSFLVLRNYLGHKISPRRQQINSAMLFSICRHLENFPVVKEAYREILYDDFDIVNARKIQEELKNHRKFFTVVETKVPSPFAQGLIAMASEDVVRLEDRKEKIKRLYSKILELLGEKGG